jgi:hypothetical protein
LSHKLAVRMYSRLAHPASFADLKLITMLCVISCEYGLQVGERQQRARILQHIANSMPKWKNVNHYGFWGDIGTDVLQLLPWLAQGDVSNIDRGQVWLITLVIYPGVPHGR